MKRARGRRSTRPVGTKGQLIRVQDQLRKDLQETTIPFQRLGEKYGVSKQAIFGFCSTRGIKRPRRDHINECSICQDLIRISRQPRSEFISSQTIKGNLRLEGEEFSRHMSLLRRKGLISERFGRLRSKRAELAYQMYFEKKLPISTIGRQAGIRDFHAVIRKHKALGWDVPDPSIMQNDEQGITTFETSKILGISASTVQRYCDKGLLKFRWSPINKKKRRLIEKESVQKLAKKYGLL